MSEKKGCFASWCSKSQQGFSLLEIMVAMTVLSIGILSIVGVQYAVVNGNTSGNVVTQQLNLAQRVMERYKNTVNPNGLGPETLDNVDEKGSPGGPYTVQVRVQKLPGVLSTDKGRLISVTVTKNGGVGGHPLTIRSMTRGYGM